MIQTTMRRGCLIAGLLAATMLACPGETPPRRDLTPPGDGPETGDLDAAAADLPPDLSADLAGDLPRDLLPDLIGPGGVTPIFRSVGAEGEAPLASGSPTDLLTITDGIAHFDTAPPPNVGVGDVIVYDADDNDEIDAADALAFIHHRLAADRFIVRDAAGDLPLAVERDDTWSVFRAYTALASAVAGEENPGIVQGLRDFDTFPAAKDLVAANRIWQIACYADAVDRTRVVVSDWTTSTTNYLRIFSPRHASETGAVQRHKGKAGTGYRLVPETVGHALELEADHTRLEGLEIAGWHNLADNNSWEAIHLAADGVLLDGLLIHDDVYTGTNPNADAINLNGMQAGQSVTIRNCVIYAVSRSAIIYQNDLDLQIRVSNCSIYNTGTSGAAADGWGGIYIASANATVVIENTISVVSGSGSDFNKEDTVSWGTSSHNISSDSSAPGSQPPSCYEQAAEQLFVSVTAGDEDLHLRAGSAAENSGKDLSAAFVEDIDGQTRSGDWEIGADQR